MIFVDISLDGIDVNWDSNRTVIQSPSPCSLSMVRRKGASFRGGGGGGGDDAERFPSLLFPFKMSRM